jgi:glycosyltransferase involved in cell wall biosynthesis
MANQTRQLARLLTEEGVQVELVPTNPPYRPAWIARMQGLRAIARLVPYLGSLWRAAGRNDLVHIMAASGWAWHLHAAPAVWIAAMRGKPAVVNYRGGGASAFFDQAFWIVRPTLRRATAIAVPSTFLERVFRARGIAPSVVPNIVDLELFRPANDGARAGDPQAPELVVARNLEPIYDVATALRAWARIRARSPRARLSVAGAGPERGRLEALAAELGLEGAVTFTGQVANHEVAGLYRRASVVLNPSRVDNMPISILEALACGVPVVSTNVGGVPDLVADGRTALLVPPGDPEAMAEAALSLLEQPARAEALRAAGLEQAREYAWARVRSRWGDVYGAALGARAAAVRATPATP